MKTPLNPRFVWIIGSIREEFPDLPEFDGGSEVILWDRQEQRVVMTLHAPYSQAMCLEVTDVPYGQPFTHLENWFNRLDNEALESEGLPVNRIKKGEKVFIKPEWQDEGDDKLVWMARDDEQGGRVDISPINTGLSITPWQTVKADMLERTFQMLV